MLRLFRRGISTLDKKAKEIPAIDNYSLSKSVLKTCNILAKVRRKNILLAAPHSGSTRLFLHVAQQMAKNNNANLISLDYQTVLNCCEEVGIIEHSNYIQDIKFTKAFSPGSYEVFQEEIEDDDDDDDISALHFDSFEPPKSKNLIVNFNVTNEEENSFSISKFSITSDSPKKETAVQHQHKNVYHTELSDNQINSFLEAFKLKLKAGKSTEYILVKDLTDMVEVESNNTGKKFIGGLIEMVGQLQEEKYPVLLIAASSPSLLDSKNLIKDKEYFAQLMDGTVSVSGDGYNEVNMATDGTLFQSVLDSMLDRFEKVELLPPAHIFLSLQASKPANKKDLELQKDQFNRYISRLGKDMEDRIAEINIETIARIFKKYNIKFTKNEYSMTKEIEGMKVRDFRELIDSFLTSEILPITKIERLVILSIGERMNTHPNESPIKITPKEVFSAINVLSETDISRFSRMSIAEREKRAFPIVDAKVETETSNKSLELEKPVEEEGIQEELKKNGVKLNKYEKRIISTVVEPSMIQTGLADLVLPSATKLALQTLISLPLMRPELFSTGVLARSSINGVLLFGPPGTGKTMLAKAIAKSSGAKFMSISLSDIFDKYIGEGEKNVRAIFTLARKIDGPCVIFLDEVDAVFGSRRSDESGGNRREIMNQFMSEWDGITNNNRGLIILGATNRPFDLDDAILRRMPRLDMPNQEARKKILAVHLKGEDLAKDVDLEELAKQTEQYSGSDLKNLCVAAALNRIKEQLVFDSTKSKGPIDESLQMKIQEKLKTIDDWGAFMKENGMASHSTVISPLKKHHFDLAFKESPPSLSDEMQTLQELRKWDKQYGDGAGNRQKKHQSPFGFTLKHKREDNTQEKNVP
ncbi:hypothetical protein HDV06_000099 [Boothiomyces sp. JEL0866]|nr:hypothetical protein HDV06_000099 [Boothiomyces sp. JEL0866]